MTADNHRGFTLIELLVTLAIFSIASLIMTKIYMNFSSSFTTQEVTAGLQQEVRSAVDLMAYELRMAGLDVNRTGLFGITQASASTIGFTSDQNLDGVMDVTDNEQVTYNITAGGVLQEILYQGTASEVTITLAENVDTANSGFVYLDQNGVPLATPVAAANLSNIRAIAITLALQEAAGRGPVVNRTITSQVICRNLAY
jgi:type IV pilus assembly protein PilW